MSRAPSPASDWSASRASDLVWPSAPSSETGIEAGVRVGLVGGLAGFGGVVIDDSVTESSLALALTTVEASFTALNELINPSADIDKLQQILASANSATDLFDVLVIFLRPEEVYTYLCKLVAIARLVPLILTSTTQEPIPPLAFAFMLPSAGIYRSPIHTQILSVAHSLKVLKISRFMQWRAQQNKQDSAALSIPISTVIEEVQEDVQDDIELVSDSKHTIADSKSTIMPPKPIATTSLLEIPQQHPNPHRTHRKHLPRSTHTSHLTFDDPLHIALEPFVAFIMEKTVTALSPLRSIVSPAFFWFAAGCGVGFGIGWLMCSLG